MIMAAEFHPTSPYANAKELFRRWQESDDAFSWWHSMTHTYGFNETIKLFQLVAYENDADQDLEGNVLQMTGDFLLVVGHCV